MNYLNYKSITNINNKLIHKMTEIDRYSRQIYSIGEEVSKKICGSTILIINYSDLTIEISKNLILMGISVDILPIETRTNNLYITYEELKNLNPLTCVNILDNNNNSNNSNNTIDYSKYNMVILTNSNMKYAIELNDLLRTQNIPFIYTGCYGLISFIFNDFLNSYTFEKTTDSTISYISDIAKNTIIFKDNHNFCVGDVIVCTYVGENVGNNIDENGNRNKNKNNSDNKFEFTIKKIVNSKNIIVNSINDTNVNNADANVISVINDINIFKNKDLNKFKVTTKITEDTYNYKSLNKCLNLTNDIVTNYGYNINKTKKIHELHLNTLDGKQINTIIPITSIIGGICSHEVIKYIGKKHTPIKQWFYFDCLEINNCNIDNNTNVCKNNYEINDVIINDDLLNCVKDKTAFVIGSGAIGCELLKNLSLLNTNMVVTDMDNIEKSNLSRQFLFGDNDIGKSKSQVASEKIKKINPNANITHYDLKLCQENKNIFNDEFHKKIDIYLNALDNIDARKYTNELSIQYLKPLIDSGTLGSNASVQVILPNVTEDYKTTVTSTEDIPICTIKSFPYKPEHVVQWARELFEQEFIIVPQLIKKYSDANEIDKLSDENIEQILCQIDKYKVAIIFDEIYDCECCDKNKCNNAKHKYNYLFHILSDIYYTNFVKIFEDIKETYKPENLIGKNMPTVLDTKNELVNEQIAEFINDSKHIFNLVLNNTEYMKYSLDNNDNGNGNCNDNNNSIQQHFIKYVECTQRYHNTFKKTLINTNNTNSNDTNVNTDTNTNTNIDTKTETETKFKTNMKTQLKHTIKEIKNIFKQTQIIFDKDNDLHINWITSISNLRNIQYSIETQNMLNTKKIAGNIIPAIITTTSIVAGLQTIEFIKICNTNNKQYNVDIFHNVNINLNLSYYQYCTPNLTQKDELNMTVWNNFVVNTQNTKEFIEYIKLKYNKTVDFITNGLTNEIIYDGENILKETIDVNDNTNVLVDEFLVVKKIFYNNEI